MYRFYLAAMDLLPAAILLIPIFCILNKVYFHNIRKSIFYYLFSCYLSVVSVLVGLPNVTYIRAELNLNLIPFIGMVADFKNSLLNILLFIPLGAALPLLWHQFRTHKNTVLFGFFTSAAIELLQILTYRTTDVNDLITNTFGTLLGFQCAAVLLRKIPVAKHPAKRTENKELILILVSTFLVMFFIYPFVSAGIWDYILA